MHASPYPRFRTYLHASLSRAPADTCDLRRRAKMHRRKFIFRRAIDVQLKHIAFCGVYIIYILYYIYILQVYYIHMYIYILHILIF